MRRTEHQKDRPFAEKVIDTCRYMTLCIANGDAPPYCVPLSPVRWGNNIYFHCAPEGRKLELMRARPVVSMSFVGSTEVPPRKFTLYYESVLAEGTASEVSDPEEKRKALRLLCEKYCPEDMPLFDKALGAWFNRTGIWKVSLDTLSSKCNFPSPKAAEGGGQP